MKKLLLSAFILLAPLPAHALEGDWELGASPAAILMPARDIYGGGAELFARYSIIDGLSVSAGAGVYGARQTAADYALGLYTLRAGMFYALDVLQWVPGAGISFSALFSEDKAWKYHRNAHGLGIDFDIYVQYRGIRHLGIGVFFSYHLVFVDDDYMTVGLSFSWNSGMF